MVPLRTAFLLSDLLRGRLLNHARYLSKSPVSRVDLVIALVGLTKSKLGGKIILRSFVTRVSTLPPRVLVTER